jgi:FixJ family two-component response regulator
MMICVVDDDSVVRAATIDLLHSLGHSATAFASAETFLDWRHANDAACLILDQNLPGLSGLELQDQLLLESSPAAIIFITAHFNPEARKRALEAGAVAYLRKPYQQGDLISALRASLSGGDQRADAALRRRGPTGKRIWTDIT